MQPMTPETPTPRDPNTTAACSCCGKTADPQLAGNAICRDCAAEAAEGMDMLGMPGMD